MTGLDRVIHALPPVDLDPEKVGEHIKRIPHHCHARISAICPCHPDLFDFQPPPPGDIQHLGVETEPVDSLDGKQLPRVFAFKAFETALRIPHPPEKEPAQEKIKTFPHRPAQETLLHDQPRTGYGARTDHDIVSRGEIRKESGQSFQRRGKIRIAEKHVFLFRTLNAAPDTISLALVDRVADGLDRDARKKGLDLCGGGIGTAVINHDDLEIGKVAFQESVNGFDGTADARALIIGGDDH